MHKGIHSHPRSYIVTCYYIHAFNILQPPNICQATQPVLTGAWLAVAAQIEWSKWLNDDPSPVPRIIALPWFAGLLFVHTTSEDHPRHCKCTCTAVPRLNRTEPTSVLNQTSIWCTDQTFKKIQKDYILSKMSQKILVNPVSRKRPMEILSNVFEHTLKQEKTLVDLLKQMIKNHNNMSGFTVRRLAMDIDLMAQLPLHIDERYSLAHVLDRRWLMIHRRESHLGDLQTRILGLGQTSTSLKTWKKQIIKAAWNSQSFAVLLVACGPAYSAQRFTTARTPKACRTAAELRWPLTDGRPPVAPADPKWPRVPRLDAFGLAAGCSWINFEKWKLETDTWKDLEKAKFVAQNGLIFVDGWSLQRQLKRLFATQGHGKKICTPRAARVWANASRIPEVIRILIILSSKQFETGNCWVLLWNFGMVWDKAWRHQSMRGAPAN